MAQSVGGVTGGLVFTGDNPVLPVIPEPPPPPPLGPTDATTATLVGFGWVPGADARETGVIHYDPIADATVIDLPYDPPESLVLINGRTMGVLLWRRRRTPRAGTDGFGGADGSAPSGRTIETLGDLTSDPLYAGVPIEFRYRFSEAMFLRPTSAGGTAVDRNADIRVISWNVSYDRCGPFSFEVWRENRPVKRIRSTSRSVGNRPTDFPDSGQSQVSVMARAEKCRVDIVSTEPWPVCFTSASWRGEYTRKSRPV
jgi:hypothetical protein